MLFKILMPIVIVVLGLTMLICALVAQLGYPGDPVVPYYVGGYIVSPAAMLFALNSWCLHWTNGPCGKHNVKACWTTILLSFMVLIFAGGILGSVFAGVGAFVGSDYTDDDACYPCRTLAAVLITCYLGTMLSSLCSVIEAWKSAKARSNISPHISPAAGQPALIWHTREITREYNTANIASMEEIRNQNRRIEDQLLQQNRLLIEQQRRHEKGSHQQQNHQFKTDELPPPYSGVAPSAPPPYEP